MSKPIVIYKNRPAVIVSETDGKFEIETESGIKKVREKDFILLGKNNTENLKTVLSAVCPKPDLSELREFFENGEAEFSELIELAWSELKPEQAWAAWQELCASPILALTAPNEIIKIRSEEEIEEFLKKQNQKDEVEKEKDEFIQALNLCIKQNSNKQNSKEYFPVKKYAQFLQDIEAFALEKSDKSKFLKEAHLKETPESAHRVLIKTGFWAIEKNPYPARAGLSLNSSKIKLPPLNLEKDFFDLTHIRSYAIDNADSTDPDDAICFDGEYLWIHIANPADTITPDSKSDLDARKRGSTLYLPEGISRMLGEEAIPYFALGLTDFSYALSFKLKLNEKAEIISVEVLRTKISVKCISYEEADAQKESGDLKPLFEIAEQNRKKREAAGAVEIKMPEVNLVVKTETGEQGEYQKVYIEEFSKTESFLMIKEMMLLAGEAAARFAFKNNIPFQYISQDAPEIPKKLPQGLAGEYRKRKAMRPRTVGTIPSMHSALGISMYSQVTSPLRRYGDLIAHQQLLKFIDSKNAKNSENKNNEIKSGENKNSENKNGESKFELMSTEDFLLRVAAGDIAGRNCVTAARNSQQHWKLVYLLQNSDWTGEAVILETIKKTSRISIPSLAYETEIRLNKELSVNEKIIVKAEEIDIPKLSIRFVEV